MSSDAARFEVVGSVIRSVESNGKHLLVTFARGDEDVVLHTHMKMTGAWHVYRPGERWWLPPSDARVVIHTAEFVAPCFRPPVVELMTTRDRVPRRPAGPRAGHHPRRVRRGRGAPPAAREPARARHRDRAPRSADDLGDRQRLQVRGAVPRARVPVGEGRGSRRRDAGTSRRASAKADAPQPRWRRAPHAFRAECVRKHVGRRAHRPAMPRLRHGRRVGLSPE